MQTSSYSAAPTMQAHSPAKTFGTEAAALDYAARADDACKCSECEETFSLDAVREFMAKWQRVLTWIDTAPANQE